MTTTTPSTHIRLRERRGPSASLLVECSGGRQWLLMALAVSMAGCQAATTPTKTAPLPTAPALTPDPLGTVTAGDSHTFSSLDSPDGRWRAEVIGYTCTPVGPDDVQAYEELILIETATGARRTADTQHISCGGLGAWGLEVRFWSPAGEYLYYTRARDGVPDGCGYWAPPLERLEASSLQIESLGSGPRSPDGSRLATWQGGDLTVWETAGGLIARHPPVNPDFSLGPIAWSPDGDALAYLQIETPCPISGTSVLVLLSTPDDQPRQLLASDSPTFDGLAWEHPDRITLSDAEGREWIFDLTTQTLEAR